jgi:hypothetical protein
MLSMPFFGFGFVTSVFGGVTSCFGGVTSGAGAGFVNLGGFTLAGPEEFLVDWSAGERVVVAGGV